MTQELALPDFHDFSEMLHQRLAIRLSEELRVPAEIMQVTAYEKFARPGKMPFSVIIKTKNVTGYLQQGIYTIEHPTKGDLALFLVPIGFDNNEMQYEIAFS